MALQLGRGGPAHPGRHPDGTVWRYQYDALGRRIGKQRLAENGVDVLEQVDFTWDGTSL
ncbi:hypothetical protein LT493_19485 [Streptomyces tricolor]|nr:hypothetical protein [Streptomyces tricolor]